MVLSEHWLWPYELHKLDNMIKGERQNVISLVGWLYSGKRNSFITCRHNWSSPVTAKVPLNTYTFIRVYVPFSDHLLWTFKE